MFEVRNESHQLLNKFESFEEAKKRAESAAKDFGKRFDIYEVKQVWTTQTLDEAIKG